MWSSFSLVAKNTSDPLAIDNLSVEIRCRDFLAETSISVHFRNTSKKGNIEAEMLFPLEEGSSVCGFATDIYGEMVDGVVISRETAQLAFENATRATEEGRIATIEHVQGNLFKARVFPVPSSGRTVKFSFLSEVKESLLHIPIRFTGVYSIPTVSCTIELTLTDPSIPIPRIISDLAENDRNFVFSLLDSGSISRKWIASTKQSNTVLSKPVTLSFRREIQSLKLLIDAMKLNQDVNDQKRQLKDYFVCINQRIPLKPNQDTTVPISINGKRIGIFWDASRSRKDTCKSMEFEVLGAIIGDLNDVHIDVILFRTMLEPAETYHITDKSRGNVRMAIFNYLNSIDYDGASDFSCIDAVKSSLQNIGSEYAYYLLFSDGLSSIGDIKPKSLEVPVYTISSDDRVNFTNLKIIAGRSGGEFFNLSQWKSSHQFNSNPNWNSIVSRIGKPPYGFISATVTSESPLEIIETYPQSPTTVLSQHLKICSYIRATPKSTVTVSMHFGYGSEIKDTITETLDLPDSNAVTESYVARLWALKKMEHILLSADQDDPTTKSLLLELGRQYGLVTPSTSMIVLDSLSQYLKYEIEPPMNLPFHEQYMKMISKIKRNREDKLDAHMAFVLSLWQRRMKWWDNSSLIDGTIFRSDIPHHLDIFDTVSNDSYEQFNIMMSFYEEEFKKKRYEERKTIEEQNKLDTTDLVNALTATELSFPVAPADLLKQLEHVYVDILEANDTYDSDNSFTPPYYEIEEKEELERINYFREIHTPPYAMLVNQEENYELNNVEDFDAFSYTCSPAYSACSAESPSSPLPQAEAQMKIEEPEPTSIRRRQTSICASPIIMSPVRSRSASPPPKKERIRRTSAYASPTRSPPNEDKVLSCTYSPLAYDEAPAWDSVDVPIAQEEIELPFFTFVFDTTKAELPFHHAKMARNITKIAQTNYLTKPYMELLSDNLDDFWRSYRKSLHTNNEVACFYFDIATWLIEKVGHVTKLAFQILLNVVELDFSNPQLLRMIAYKMEELNLIDYAINLYERIWRSRPEEPQSHRDLALALLKRGSKEDVQRALTLLTTVVLGEWDLRFTQVEVVAMMDLQHAVNLVDLTDQLSKIDNLTKMRRDYGISLSKPMSVDLRVVLTWNTDMTDLELHVKEPSGEDCYAFHNYTKSGGMTSMNMVQGYGPEEYLIRKATPGTYQVYIKLFSSRGKTATQPVIAQVKVYQHYGDREREMESVHVVQLSNDKEIVHVIDINY